MLRRDRKSGRAAEPRRVPPGRSEPAPQDSRVGRRPGRHSSPDYRQYSVWLRKRTRLAVDLALSEFAFQEGKKKQFSTLAEELFSDWLARHGGIRGTADET